MTKPRKKYRPRTVRTPAILLRLAPEASEREFQNLDLPPKVALRAIEMGDPSIENFIMLKTCLKEGYVLSAAYEEKWEVKSTMLMAYVTLCEAEKDFKTGCQTIFSLDAIHVALNTLSDLERGIDRYEMAQAANAVANNIMKIMRFNPDDVWRLGPHHSSWPVGEYVMCFHQGELRFGKLERKDRPYAPILRTAHGSFVLHDTTIALVVHIKEGDEIPCI